MFKIKYTKDSEGVLSRDWKKYIEECCNDCDSITVDEFIDIIIECTGGIDINRDANSVKIILNWDEATIRVVSITSTNAIIELIF